MTRIALPTWEGRVSPVFDVAERLLLVDVVDAGECGRCIRQVSDPALQARAQALAAHDVDILICGAISRDVEQMVTAAGIEVVSGICGDVERVLREFVLGVLEADVSLHLPGSPPGPVEEAREGHPAPRPDHAHQQRAPAGRPAGSSSTEVRHADRDVVCDGHGPARDARRRTARRRDG